MHAITLKNIPDDIHNSLKSMAKLNHRSLNNEIIHCLEMYTKVSKVETDLLLNKAHFSRSKIAHTFSNVEINNAKNEGRK